LRNRRTICRRYLALGHFRLPRQFRAMTVDRMPSSFWQVAWLASASYPASARTVSIGVLLTARRTAGMSWGASWRGPRVTDADRNRWVRVSMTAVSFGQCRWRPGRPHRAAKYRLTGRASYPVESTAARAAGAGPAAATVALSSRSASFF
jgi:hypothetical protein